MESLLTNPWGWGLSDTKAFDGALNSCSVAGHQLSLRLAYEATYPQGLGDELGRNLEILVNTALKKLIEHAFLRSHQTHRRISAPAL